MPMLTEKDKGVLVYLFDLYREVPWWDLLTKIGLIWIILAECKDRLERPAGAPWVVMNGRGTLFRSWNRQGPCWTSDPDKATQYFRCQDAELAHEDDEDAWSILPLEQAMEKLCDVRARSE